MLIDKRMKWNKTIVDWDSPEKEVEWKDGVKWIYYTEAKPESNYLRYSIKYDKDVFAEYECKACGKTFHKSFDHDGVPEIASHRPLCSSLNLKYWVLRKLYGFSQGMGELKKVEVYKHYSRERPPKT